MSDHTNNLLRTLTALFSKSNGFEAQTKSVNDEHGPEYAGHALIHHQDMNVTSLDRFLKEPRRIKQEQVNLSLDSFIDYLDRFGRDETVVFVRTNPFMLDHMDLLAIIDYHDRDDGADTDRPSFCTHVVHAGLFVSNQLRRWHGATGKWMNQEDFALFLEDNLPDIIEPDAATVLEQVQDLTVHSDWSVNSVVRLDSGLNQLVYDEKQHSTKYATQIKISTPLFENGTGDLRTFTIRVRCKLAANGEGKKVPHFMLSTVQFAADCKAALLHETSVIEDRLMSEVGQADNKIIRAARAIEPRHRGDAMSTPRFSPDDHYRTE